MSVPLDVRQRFLRDPVGGHLDGGGEPGSELGASIVTEVSGRGLLRGQPAERGGEPELVERRRAKP